jgi:hypothetical protein
MWYAKGMCRNGALCRFLHGNQDPEVAYVDGDAAAKKQDLPQRVPKRQPLKPQISQMKPQPQMKPQIPQLQPQHAPFSGAYINQAYAPLTNYQEWNAMEAPLTNYQDMDNAYAAWQLNGQNGLNFVNGLNDKQQEKDLNSFYCPPLLPGIKPQDTTAPPLSNGDDSPFLGTLRELQTRLNDISRMNESLGVQCRQNHQTNQHETANPQNPQMVQVGHLRLSEETINSHQVDMLSQDIQSLTNQIKKLKASIIPAQGNKSVNAMMQNRSGTTTTADDSSSNTRSSAGRSPPH